jgi:HAD superfamily hydrolase (TIGR01450 family)
LALLKDYFGKDATKLTKKKLWLFDMDGTIYRDGKLIQGTLELLRHIEQNHGKYIFITNNSSKSVSDYVDYVTNLQIRADESNFFTSAQATILYIRKKYKNAHVYCQGTKSFLTELRKEGINVTNKVEPVDLVVVGFDTELTTEKLRNTCEVLTTQKVDYIATNPDLACPTWFGFVPDCGAICNMIASATGKKPRYMGKPTPIMVQEVCNKWNYELKDTVVVGDRLYTDIATGLNAGADTICVLSGEASPDEILSSDIKPMYTFSSVYEIAALFE